MGYAAAGIVVMCITGCFMKLWKTLFAGCGKAGFAFPWAVNRVFHNGIACYAYFHDADIDYSLPGCHTWHPDSIPG